MIVPTPVAGADETVVMQAEPVVGARRGIGRTQSREAVEHGLKIGRVVAEMTARPAALVTLRGHRTKFSQCAANTTADRTNPSTTLTATPEVNARNGLPPACANS